MLDSEYCIYLAPYDAVYIDIAKVASSSLKAIFADTLGLNCEDGNPHEIEFPRLSTPHSKFTGLSFPAGVYSFGFVRNPWDRLVSCYRDKICGEVNDFTRFTDSGVALCLARFDVFTRDMPFEAFVRAVAGIPDADADEHFRSQTDFLTDSAGRIVVDFVGRFESLSTDFEQVAHKINLPVTELPRLQVATRSVDYVGYYSPELRALVATRYASDIACFSYDFD